MTDARAAADKAEQSEHSGIHAVYPEPASDATQHKSGSELRIIADTKESIAKTAEDAAKDAETEYDAAITATDVTRDAAYKALDALTLG